MPEASAKAGFFLYPCLDLFKAGKYQNTP